MKNKKLITNNQLQESMHEYEKILKEANYLSKYDLVMKPFLARIFKPLFGFLCSNFLPIILPIVSFCNSTRKSGDFIPVLNCFVFILLGI